MIADWNPVANRRRRRGALEDKVCAVGIRLDYWLGDFEVADGRVGVGAAAGVGVESQVWLFVKGFVCLCAGGVVLAAATTATADIEEDYDGEDEQD